MIRIVHAVVYDDTNHVRLALTNEDPTGGWTPDQLAALITHITQTGDPPHADHPNR